MERYFLDALIVLTLGLTGPILFGYDSIWMYVFLFFFFALTNDNSRNANLKFLTIRMFLLWIGVFYSEKYCAYWTTYLNHHNPNTLTQNDIPDAFVYSLNQMPDDIKNWIKLFLFNRTDSADAEELKKSFKSAGVLHVLVISGTHINTFLKIICGLISIPLRLTYLLLIPIKPNQVPFFHSLIPWLGLGLVWLYTCIAGLTAPIQRSLLMGFAIQCKKSLEIDVSTKSVLLAAFTMQTIFFPNTILGVSSLLSWGSLILSSGSLHQKNNPMEEIRESIITQVRIILLVYLLVDDLNVIGIFSNLLLLPFGSVVLITSFIVLMFSGVLHDSFLINTCNEFIHFFIYLIDCFSYFHTTLPNWNNLESFNHLCFLKTSCLVVVLIGILNNLKTLSISTGTNKEKK